MQSTEELMAPATRSFGEGESQYTEVYQHIASVPAGLIKQVSDIVAVRKQTRKRATLREIYVEAVDDFLAALRRGEEIEVLAAPKSGRDVHFWLRDDLAEELNQACDRLDRRKNVVFATALGRWIEQRGR
jgi:hypothetical protein